MKPIGDIRFANPNQTVGVTRYRVIAPCNTTNGGTVEFYGTGVPDLVRRMQAADQTSIPAVLQNTGSRTLTITLSDIKQTPSDPTRATGKLTLASKPPPGKYTGTLALSQDVVNAPKTTVEVDSRAWFLWAIVFILLGVVTSAAVTNWLALRRRKALLNRELEDIVKNYRDYRDLNYPEDPNGETGPRLIWDCNVTYPLAVSPDWEYFDDLKSTNNIYTAIHWARNDADLDEAQVAVDTVRKLVETWVNTVKAASVLYDLDANPPFEAPKATVTWAGTNTANQTDLLLRKVQHMPQNGNASDALPQAIARQAAWHCEFANAWELRARLVALAGLDISISLLNDVDKNVGPPLDRTDDAQDKLDAGLAPVMRDLEEDKKEHPEVRFTPRRTSIVDAMVAEYRARAVLRSAAPQTGALAIRSAQAFVAAGPAFPVVTAYGDITATTHPHAALAQGEVGAPAKAAEDADAPNPNGAVTQPPQEAGAATTTDAAGNENREGADDTNLDKADKRHRTEADAASGEKARAKNPTPQEAVRGNANRFLRWLKLRDTALSLAIVLVSVLVYSATLYTTTWGTIGDLATAFGAGFAGQVTVKWGVLPIFRSVRSHGAAAATGAAGSAAA